MVIINKHSHTKRHTAKRKSSFLSTLSILLALLMMLSIPIAGIPTISALKCSYFTHQEAIYIDMTALTGWDESGANIRVYTYYGDSDENWNVENNKADSACYNNACFQNAITPSSVVNDVYSFNITGDKVGYVKVLRLDSGMTKVWNTTGFAYDKDRSGSANCIKITGWDNSYQWTTYSPTGGTDYYEVTASPDSTITGNSNLYTIDATFYDYYTDGEIQRGWGNINYEESHGYWEPYTKLNNKIASASSGVPYPMYFGNFFDKNDGYTGEGSSNMVNFSNWVNNSARLGDTHKSVVGLTGPNLVNGELYYAANGGGNGTQKVPFFDKSFLQSNKVGSVVNTKFPMRKVVDNGITTYKFNSEGSTAKSAGDSVWFNAARDTISYGYGNDKGSKDALYYYSNPKTASGYGFFPFDSNRGADKEAYDFGFGMRVDVKFNLGADDNSHIGQIKGTNGSYVDQKFTFTGDDDVWVYVDGKLILDLGGDHQKANGEINFHNRSVTVSKGTNTVNNATRNTSFTLDNYGDPTAEHTLTMFYVERGMVESNLSFDFNFAPVSNQLVSEKIVNTTELNAGIRDYYAVKNADSFTFTSSQLNGKQYSYAHTDANGTRTSSTLTANNSKYTLRNKDTATFNDQLEVETTVNVSESFPSSNVFTYEKTSWEVVDTSDNTVIAESDDSTEKALDSQFVFRTHKTGTFDPTKLKLTYTNTPAKANAVIKKNVIDYYGDDVSDTKTFPATVSLSFDKGQSYKAYPLKYTVTGNSTQRTMTDGQVTLQEGKDITIPNLPVGTYVKVVENSGSLGGYTNTTGTVVMQVVSGGATRTITNKQPPPGEATVTLQAKKELTGANLSNGSFEFTLLNTLKAIVERKTCTASGSVTFTSMTYSEPVSDEVYYIREVIPITNKDNDVESYDESIYKVVINVTKVGNNLVPDVKYYPVLQENPEQLGAPLTGTNIPTFTNVIKDGEVTIVKEDNTGADVEGVEFGIYKVSGDGASLNGLVPIAEDETEIMTVTVNNQQVQKSAVKFSNLSLYTDNTYRTANKNYQWYAVAEIDPATGYFKSNKVIYFQLPISGSYTPTFSYVNGHIINPNTSGDGMFGIKMLGIYAIAFAGLTALAFVMYNKRKAKKSARHFRAE